MTSDKSRVFIIAEAGVNHNGSLDLALQLVDVAARSGVDAVKFQTFRADRLVSRDAVKAEYQQLATGSEEGQFDMVRHLELSAGAHEAIVTHCRERNIQFLSSPFDEESAAFLVRQLNVPLIKIPSGEITNGPLLVSIARLGRPVILSTGMSTLADVEDALGAIAFGYLGEGTPSRSAFRRAFASEAGNRVMKNYVRLLHCTTEYPAPYDETNLRAMDTLRSAFDLPVGLSDHTAGIVVPIAAVARGATVVEKHFTLDKTLPGPDHRASLDPAELTAMVSGIRHVEAALGDGRKIPSPAELKNVSIARKRLVAARQIHAGELFSENNLTAKRPGGGVSPMECWNWYGRVADRDYAEDEPLG